MSESSFIFGVDLDGVCADYSLGLRAVVASELGVAESSLPMQRSWDFGEWGLDADAYQRMHRTAVLDHRMLRDLPVIEGAADTLWRLSDAGVWIRIITHRLYVNWGHATAVADTVTWLDAARIPYRDICFLGTKPQVEAHLYIDDAPHNIEALRSAGNDVIVFAQSYNADLQGPRAESWTEVEALTLDALARHQGAAETSFPGFDAGASRLERRLSGD